MKPTSLYKSPSRLSCLKGEKLTPFLKEKSQFVVVTRLCFTQSHAEEFVMLHSSGRMKSDRSVKIAYRQLHTGLSKVSVHFEFTVKSSMW